MSPPTLGAGASGPLGGSPLPPESSPALLPEPHQFSKRSCPSGLVLSACCFLVSYLICGFPWFSGWGGRILCASRSFLGYLAGTWQDTGSPVTFQSLCPLLPPVLLPAMMSLPPCGTELAMAGDRQISSHSLPGCRCPAPGPHPWDALLPPCPAQLLPTFAPSLSPRQAGHQPPYPHRAHDTPAESVFVLSFGNPHLKTLFLLIFRERAGRREKEKHQYEKRDTKFTPTLVSGLSDTKDRVLQ